MRSDRDPRPAPPGQPTSEAAARGGCSPPSWPWWGSGPCGPGPGLRCLHECSLAMRWGPGSRCPSTGHAGPPPCGEGAAIGAGPGGCVCPEPEPLLGGGAPESRVREGDSGRVPEARCPSLPGAPIEGSQGASPPARHRGALGGLPLPCLPGEGWGPHQAFTVNRPQAPSLTLRRGNRGVVLGGAPGHPWTDAPLLHRPGPQADRKVGAQQPCPHGPHRGLGARLRHLPGHPSPWEPTGPGEVSRPRRLWAAAALGTLRVQGWGWLLGEDDPLALASQGRDGLETPMGQL